MRLNLHPIKAFRLVVSFKPVNERNSVLVEISGCRRHFRNEAVVAIGPNTLITIRGCLHSCSCILHLNQNNLDRVWCTASVSISNMY